jgi:hypothetical protein
MEDAKARALKEYEDALTFILTHSLETRDSDYDLQMRTRLYNADKEIERHSLRDTPEYKEAVLRADQNAREQRKK